MKKLFFILLTLSLTSFSQTAEEYNYKGVAKYNLKDYSGAIADFNKAIQLNPDFALAYRNRGNTKQNLKDYTGAIVDFNKAIQLNPDYALAYYNRGNTKTYLNDLAGACTDWTKAGELGSTDALTNIQKFCESKSVSANSQSYNSQDVKIGSYFVTSKNLDVSKYRNGEEIPQVNDPNQWANLETGAWCYFNNDPTNASIFGKLYNWYAVHDPRGIAPIGYHVISDDEFTSIINVLGGDFQAGSKLNSVNSCDNGIGSNESGFNGVLGGYRSPTGNFNYLYEFGGLWSSNEDINNNNNAWYRQLNCNKPYVPRASNSKNIGFSVRCIKQKP